jgi:phospholipid N-methyltransferase
MDFPSASGVPGQEMPFSSSPGLRALASRIWGSPLISFARALFASPRHVGAFCPSSRRLAQRMAEEVSPGEDGLVVELGGGTGVITAALLARGVQPGRLIVVEKAPQLASHLKRRFPGVRVVQGDAAELLDLLGPECEQVTAVVSGLPMNSLPRRTVTAIGTQVAEVLGRHGRLIQFTYRPRRRPRGLPRGFRKVRTRAVWGNLPPAAVEVFRRVA